MFPIIPQAATAATLTATVEASPGEYPNLGAAQAVTGTATLLQGGATLPVIDVAEPVAAVGIGGVLVVVQRRRRRAGRRLQATSTR